MKILQIHDEIEVNQDAERVVAYGEKGSLCCAPGLGLWAGRHLFYVTQYKKDKGILEIFPLVGNEYNADFIRAALGLDELFLIQEGLVGVDPIDIAILSTRTGLEVISIPETSLADDENHKPHKKGKF